jgi:GNAT superfamily N-acetyltransferase
MTGTAGTGWQAPPTIRRATVADLAPAYDIFCEHERLESPDAPAPPPGDVPPWLRHEFATGEMWVAEREGQVVGFAALLRRGPVDYLAELFVRAAQQSTGVGTALLRRILAPVACRGPSGPSGPSGLNDVSERRERIRCTLASRDPRALALYVRTGMRPRWPNLWLKASIAGLRRPLHSGVRPVEAARGDPELVRWDAAVGGRHRPDEHAYWVRQAGIPLWFERRGRRVGYAYVRPHTGSIWSPDTTTVGPVGVASPVDAEECVCAAVAFAGEHSESVRLAIPGPHPGLRALLDAGLRIVDVETFVSTAALVDAERYVGSGDLF